MKQNDPVNYPKHYTSHPSGVECIDITRHYDFAIGNAIKYLWRAGIKVPDGDSSAKDIITEIEDLKKAIWYINDKIQQLEKELNTYPESETRFAQQCEQFANELQKAKDAGIYVVDNHPKASEYRPPKNNPFNY